MPRYFFDVDDRGRRVVDRLGMEHADLGEAMCDAMFLIKLLAIHGRLSTRPGPIRVTVREATAGHAHDIVIDCSGS